MKKFRLLAFLFLAIILLQGCALINNQPFITLDQTSMVYDGEEKNPGITVIQDGNVLEGGQYTISEAEWTDVGEHTVTATIAENKTITAKFKIIPRSTKIKSISATSSDFTIQWRKRVNQVTGYEVQYSRNSDFSDSKTVKIENNETLSCTVKDVIENDRYYVRVRTYHTVDDVNYYSMYTRAVYITIADVQPTYDTTEEQILRDGEWQKYAADDTECKMIDHVSEVLPTTKHRRYFMRDDGVWSDGKNNGESAVIMFTGDLLCQTRQQEAAKDENGQYNFKRSFKLVKDVFDDADLVVGNLEVTMCDKASYMAEEIEVATSPHVNAPSAWLNALDYAGFDVLTVANNHNLDVGAFGIFTTLRHINDYGFVSTGLFNSEETPRYQITETKGIKIAHIAYGVFYNRKEHYLTKDAQEMMFNHYSEKRVKKDVAAAKKAGAEFVVVYMHWGTQYQHEPPEKSYNRAQEIADAGADYIVGSHPHVVSKYDYVTAKDGRQVPVWYSLGNFISHQEHLGTKSTLIVRLTLKKEDGKVVIEDEGYIPCRTFVTIKGKPYVVVPLTAPYSAGYENKYFPASFNSTVKYVGPKVKMLGEFLYKTPKE